MRSATVRSSEQTQWDEAGAAAPNSITFERLFDEFESPLLNYFYYRLGSWHDAEDLAQQVFTKAYAAYPRFRARPGEDAQSTRSWIFAIAHNELANHHRHRDRHPGAPLSEAEAQSLADKRPGPEETAVHADAHARMLALLDQLSEPQRQVVELRLAGLTDAEIGHLLDRNQGAVRALQFRAVTRLRTLMGIAHPSQEDAHD
jgi:RNA polymerase sigma-70 factor (ECF subfamily)